MMGKIIRVSLEVLNVTFWTLIVMEMGFAQAALSLVWFGDHPMGAAFMYAGWAVSLLACIAGERMVCAKIGRVLT